MQELIPLLHFLIRHPVIIPPIDKLDNTYKLEEEKNPITNKSQLDVSDNYIQKLQQIEYGVWRLSNRFFPFYLLLFNSQLMRWKGKIGRLPCANTSKFTCKKIPTNLLISGISFSNRASKESAIAFNLKEEMNIQLY